MNTDGNASDNGGTLDLGDEYLANQQTGRRTGGGQPSSNRSGRATNAADSMDPFWTIVLKTFNEGDHPRSAATMVQELRRIDAALASRARVHTKSSGSLVIVGRYDDRDDPQARTELERLRTMNINGTPVFARVMLVHVTPEMPVGVLHQYDLRTVRERFPNVDLIYTVDVAVWMDPAEWGDDQGAAASVDIQREAERYTNALRAQGHEAYFYHDPARGLSTVTVGVFGSGAIVDASVGILRSDVEDLRRRFTPRLVNGEPLYQARDVIKFSRDPNAQDLVAQKPQLVVVPK